MPVTREQASGTLEALGVAPIFVQSYLDERLPKNLDLFFRPPEELFIAPDQQEYCTADRLVPLLDNGSFSLVLFYDPKKEIFIQKDIEDPHEETCFTNWQQYLAELMIRIIESTDADDDDPELVEIAEILEFRYLRDTLSFLDAPEGAHDQYEIRKAKFIATIRDR